MSVFTKIGSASSHVKSVVKAITWRFVASADTFVLSFALTGKISAAAGIAGAEVFTKIGIYYAHERAWSWVMPTA